ncbi:MAG: magnesium/cobalt transporter CorA [Nanoarchaeota archaeon]|nr:magnesium/cobalt transporter CorA [Nanoarchaeota archaeon]MBU1031087.1 magnesium/cobalt transporter CorA [Nanoarchaeota archaeon]MBU1849684.1 magnesium/cobalt transporter CorA [Nanoarchaeota archaeon]
MIEITYFDRGVKNGLVSKLSELIRFPLWIDVTNMTKDESKLLEAAFGLHQLTSEDLLNSCTRIKNEEFPEYLFSVFYGIKNTKKIELTELDFVLSKKFLITNHKIKLDSFEKLKQNNARLEALFKKGLDFLFHDLLDQEIDNYFPVLETIDDQLEKIEEEVTKKPKPELLNKILQLKRQIIFIKKTAIPQREKISFLMKEQSRFLSKKITPYFRDVYDHSIRVSDSIENYREAIGGTFDAYMSAVSNNMNEVMKVLSIIATIALPLTVISGIYGTNFTNLPGAGFKYGFLTMILLMILMCFGIIYFFKKRKWF